MPRATRSAWSGSISFGGFPISLRAYNLIVSRSAQSFKSLCPCHQQPVVMPKRCPVDDHPLGSDELLRGHQVSKDNIVPVPPEAVEALRDAEATKTLEISGLPLLTTVPLHLGTAHYRLVPDEKVPGSEQPAQVLWNGLIETERALITEWVPRAGSRDQLLAVHADAHGLNGSILPYMTELQDTPEFQPVRDEKAAAMFESFAQVNDIAMDAFHHSDFESKYEQRRQQAIEAALSGKPIPVAEPGTPSAPAPDLMAAMEAALQTRAPAKTKTTKPKAARKKEKVA